MPLGAIYYVKYLKNIQGALPIRNGPLASLADVSVNTISQMRTRHPASEGTQSAVKSALERFCLESRKITLAEFMSSMDVRDKGALSYSDVFQVADWQAQDLRASLDGAGLSESSLQPFLNGRQASEVLNGYCFTPFIKERIEAVFASIGRRIPDSVMRRVDDAQIVAIVDET